METLTSLLSWRHIAATVAAYYASVAFYRLFLHPLAGFPGPKLAALTRWYEAYYDVVQNGQYIFRIMEMHKKYGPIVRISPFELHINDPAFFEKLYRQEGRWDKYAWAYDAFSGKGSTLCTADHDLHKARRKPLSSFFSKAKVTERKELIERNVAKLCSRLSEIASDKKSVDLGAALSAYARDVAAEFLLGKDYDNLGQEDFNAGVTIQFQGSGKFWRITKHVRWFGPTMMSIPKDWVINSKSTDEGTKNFFRFLQRAENDTMEILGSLSSTAADSDIKTPRHTVIHSIVGSGLPPEEESATRIYEEIGVLMAAGFETMASTLRLICFHVFSNPDIVSRLRTELASASLPPDPSTADMRTLEQLPYLTSILMEGLRMSPGISGRMQRIAPDRELVYGAWRIPAGTPVGMTTLMMHMDESLYPEPKRFNPDRWMDLEARKRAEKTYAPFSRGTRVCLGIHLAWAEMYLVLSALVQLFDFQFVSATAEDFECDSDQFSIGTKGQSVLTAHVTPRKY